MWFGQCTYGQPGQGLQLASVVGHTTGVQLLYGQLGVQVIWGWVCDWAYNMVQLLLCRSSLPWAHASWFVAGHAGILNTVMQTKLSHNFHRFSIPKERVFD